ncbi:MAG TPA: hypothetical protein ENF37_07780 [Beggiatoa sp.]|nr:hypothetical protein [Beggiatoa sp.]
MQSYRRDASRLYIASLVIVFLQTIVETRCLASLYIAFLQTIVETRCLASLYRVSTNDRRDVNREVDRDASRANLQ